jgi:hypothetical protein
MDTNGDGHIGYDEFCQLCEERWRKIDPFEAFQKHVINNKEITEKKDRDDVIPQHTSNQ